MSMTAIILLEGLAFALVFSLLSLMRQEGVSPRLLIETLLITLVVGGLSAANAYATHPVLFLIVLYLITMRVRLLMDIGNMLAKRQRFAQAESVYALARRLGPDSLGQHMIDLNQAAVALQQGRFAEAIAGLTQLLDTTRAGPLGPRYEAAGHYNLGIAYRRTGKDAQATREFNAAVDAWPGSPFARRAQRALEQMRQKPKDTSSE